MFPTDSKLLNRAFARLVALVKKTGPDLRQSYARVGKFALIRTGGERRSTACMRRRSNASAGARLMRPKSSA